MSGLVPSDAFAAVRVRWLPLVAVGALVALVVVAAVLRAVAGDAVAPDALFAVLLYVPLVLWTLWQAWRHRIRLGVFFRRPRIGRYWWVVAGMTVVLFLFSIGAANITGLLLPGYADGAGVDTGAGLPLLFVSLVVLPPLVEELVFRGMLLERWSVKWRLGVAIVVQAVVFGVLHVDPVGAGMFGVVMALMYIRTRSLWVPIAMHAANNGTVLLFVSLAGDAAAEQSPTDPAQALIGAAIFLVLSAPFIVAFIRRNWPTADTLTPYEAAEFGDDALPPRHLGRVTIIEGPYGLTGRSGRLWVEEGGVVVMADRNSRVRLTSVAYPALAAITVSADLATIVLVAGDGTSVTFTQHRRTRRGRESFVAALGKRAVAGGGPMAGWALQVT